VSGSVLAEATGVSLRTLYRDIETLKADGAHIDGERRRLCAASGLHAAAADVQRGGDRGAGARLALVHQRADRALADAAANVLAKIGAVLPKDLRETLDDSGLLIAPGEPSPQAMHNCPRSARPSGPSASSPVVPRQDGAASRRTVWPFAVGFFEKARVVVACASCAGFRHFRTDRITTLTVTDRRYPRRRKPCSRNGASAKARQKPEGC